MGLIKSFFTWWDGPTWGTRLFTRLHGEEVGRDEMGNIYFRTRDGVRRWVIYAGENEASAISSEWHRWLHKSTDLLPEEEGLPVRSWEKPRTLNLTGTPHAYARPGALQAGGQREAATGDYEAWRPEQ